MEAISNRSPRQVQWVGFVTILRKEVRRFLRLWVQTIVPPMVTMSLYFLIFGHLVGQRVGTIEGYPYVSFIAPGIIMLSMLTNTYANVSSSFFIEKFVRSLEEMMYAPIRTVWIVTAFILAAVMRGVVVGIGVFTVAHFFTVVPIAHPALACLIAVLSMTVLASIGLLNALLANHFDGINLIPTFVLTPLIYLGGVFFPISMLSPFWHHVAWFNPLAYMISGFRYCLLGQPQVPLGGICIMIVVVAMVFMGLSIYRIEHRKGILLK